MAVTRIKNNQITDATVNAAAKLQDYSITATKLANSLTYGSDLTISGNLTVNGNTTAIDTNVTTIEDPVIVLASQQSGSPAVDIGFIGERGTSTNIAFVWDESAGTFVTAFTSDAETSTTITITAYADLKTENLETVGNVTIGGDVDITGNVASLDVTGNVTANYFFGNGSQLSGIDATSITNGDSNVRILAANANITMGVNGTANVVVVDDGGGNVDGTWAATGNVSGGNIVTGGAVVATGDVGGATVTATGNVSGGNIVTGGDVVATGDVSGATGTFTGNVDAGNLTTSGDVTTATVTATGNISGGNVISSGDVTTATVTATGNVAGGNLTTGGQVVATGNVSGGNIVTGGDVVATGDVSGATGTFTGNVDAGNLTTSGDVTTATVTATGNVSGGNLVSSGDVTTATVTATGNVSGGNVISSGIVSATGNVAGGNLTTGGAVDATGNIGGGNINTSGDVVATGNVNAGNVNTDNLVGTTVTITSTSGDIVFSSSGNIDAGNVNILNVAEPVSDTDAANKGYVDSVAQGLDVKQSCLVATANTLANYSGGTISYDNGTDGVGATLTTTGTFTTIDGVSVATAGTRVLVKNESTQAWNGIYSYTNSTTLTRTTDFDNGSPSGEIPGGFTFIEHGDTNADTGWVCTTNAPVTVGTTAIVFSQFSGAGQYTAGDGLALTGTTFSVNVDDETTAIVGDNVVVKTSANLVTPNIGNATGNSLTLTGTGNISGGNISISGIAAVTGNVSGGNITTGGVVEATGNVSGGNINTGGDVVATGDVSGATGTFTGNVSGGNLTTSGDVTTATVTATGNISGGNVISSGDVTTATVTATGNIAGGNLTTGGQVDATGNVSGGNINTGGDVVATGDVSGATGTFTGNVSGGNLTTSGDVTTATVTATGNISGGNLSVTGDVAGATGTFTGNVSGGNVTTGGVVTATGNVSGGNLTTGGDVVATGDVSGATGTFTGNVSGGNLTTGGDVVATGDVSGATATITGNISGGNIETTGIATLGNIVISGDNITNGASNFISINAAGSDIDLIVSGDNQANLLVVDAGTDTVLIGTGTPTTNAALVIGTTNSMLVPVGNTAQRPATGVSGMVRYNSQTGFLEYYDADSWTNAGSAFTVIADEQFNGDGSTVAFTLASEQTTASCIVSINGVVQIPTVAYSVSGTTLTFTEAPLSGDVIDVRELTTTTTVASISNESGNAAVEASATSATVTVTGDLAVSGIINTNADGVGNIGNATVGFNTIFAKATSAQYADLAEMYEADAEYAPGTVVCFGGDKEVTVCDHDEDTRVAGVVSTNPSYLMNSDCAGEHVAAVALTGRVPCRVVGPVKKGDLMVSAGNGSARAKNDARNGSVIGKALQDFNGVEGTIEVVVGRF